MTGTGGRRPETLVGGPPAAELLAPSPTHRWHVCVVTETYPPEISEDGSLTLLAFAERVHAAARS